MAKPTSAFLRAGPSLVPSPVTATTSRFSEMLLSMIPLTRMYLSVGDDRANTRSRGQTASSKCCCTCRDHWLINWLINWLIDWLMVFTSPLASRMRWLNSLPSRMRESTPGWMIPHLIAMDRAVLTLSPVTMRTVIPARWHLRIASGTFSHKKKNLVNDAGSFFLHPPMCFFLIFLKRLKVEWWDWSQFKDHSLERNILEFHWFTTIIS